MFNVLKDKLGNIIDPHIPRYDNLGKYSTDEINTKKKWINGKDIYRKTFNFNINTLTNQFTFDANINNLDIITKIEAMCILQDNTFIPFPHVGTGSGNLGVRFYNGKIRTNGTETLSDTKQLIVTLEYIKK